MSAEHEIAELDKSLAEDGEDIWLRRVVGVSQTTQQFIDVKCRAFVRGQTPDEVIGAVAQTVFDVVLSATQINRAQWPGGQPPAGHPQHFAGDPRVPNKNRGDKAKVRGMWRSVETGVGIPIDGQLVRINMRVMG